MKNINFELKIRETLCLVFKLFQHFKNLIRTNKLPSKKILHDLAKIFERSSRRYQ